MTLVDQLNLRLLGKLFFLFPNLWPMMTKTLEICGLRFWNVFKCILGHHKRKENTMWKRDLIAVVLYHGFVPSIFFVTKLKIKWCSKWICFTIDLLQSTFCCSVRHKLGIVGKIYKIEVFYRGEVTCGHMWVSSTIYR